MSKKKTFKWKKTQDALKDSPLIKAFAELNNYIQLFLKYQKEQMEKQIEEYKNMIEIKQKFKELEDK